VRGRDRQGRNAEASPVSIFHMECGRPARIVSASPEGRALPVAHLRASAHPRPELLIKFSDYSKVALPIAY